MLGFTLSSAHIAEQYGKIEEILDRHDDPVSAGRELYDLYCSTQDRTYLRNSDELEAIWRADQRTGSL